MVKMKFIPALLFAALGLLIMSCEKHSAPGSSVSAPAPTNQQIFQVKGVVVEVQLAEKSVRIRHEEITNYMGAMTMNFDVRDVKELAGLAPGDAISFRMTVTDTDGWIDQIRKLHSDFQTNAVPAKLSLPSGIRVLRDVDPLGVGDSLPDYRFTNHLGQAVNLTQFRGQALAFTFIFTRCPFPTFCPLMSNNFRAVQDALLKTPNAPTNWHLFTITFDPEWDTPERLHAYSKNYGCNPAHWSFLTGDLVEISTLAEQVGQIFARDTEGNAGINHNLRTVVVDARGHVQNIIPENKWKPDELAAEIVKAAAAK
jgi:protein SCO1